MKNRRRRAAAATLALVLGLTPLASASDAMGHDIQSGSVDLSIGTSLTKQIFWSDTYSDLRTERYFTYKPNTDVTPVVSYGDKVLNRVTLTDMAKSLENQGKRVVGGINGDFYVMATGAPVGLVVTDGVLRSSAPYQNSWALGFRADGTAFIGRPEMATTVTFKGQTLLVSGGVNKIRTQEGGYFLYTSDFHANTQNTVPGVDVILTPVLAGVGETVDVDLDVTGGAAAPQADTGEEANSSKDLTGAPAPEEADKPVTEVKETLTKSGKLVVGGRVTCTVEQVLESTGAVNIPEGKFVLSINGKTENWQYQVEQLRALQPGDTVDIDVSTGGDTRWTEAVEAIGGMYKLVSGGVVESGLSAERTARSAVGIKADGSVVFYTMDGKQEGYSVGANLTQVAMRMIELGCVEAVCMDGGGSTTIGATYPDGDSMGLINKPSDGSQRANSTAIFLATEMKPTGEPGSWYVTPNDNLLLAGASVQMTATALDTAYYKMASPGTPAWTAEGGGTVDENGLYTAGSESGVAQVTASYEETAGSATVTVVKTPEQITLSNEATGAALPALSLEPGAQIDLKANAFYKKLALTSQDACYVWTADPAVGTVDENGVFTAAEQSGTGTLTVSAGGTVLTVPVTVAGHVLTLEDFEGGIASMTSTQEGRAHLETGMDHVRYGRQSLRLDYDASALGTASVITTLTIRPGEKYLNLWVYGDGSHNSLTATVADSQGATQEVLLTGLDYTGWKSVTVPLPTDAAALRTLNLIYGGGETDAGAVWIDQITTSNELLNDTTPPVVTPSISGGKLTASIVDNVDKGFTAGQVKVAFDGAALKFDFNVGSGILNAALPASYSDGKLHRISITVTDASGNVGRGGLNVQTGSAGEDGPVKVFADTAGHWAEPYAVYLYDRKISAGIPDEVNNTLLFQPDKAITRGEFFLLIARWMGTDVSGYAGTELPFVDTADIPDWALGGVKAMYAQGILKGSDDGQGNLRANATATISRAEAMTLLGRVQAKGYSRAELTGFTDGAQVPEWSAEYVGSLVAQGVVSGFEGKITPNDSVKRGEVAKMLFVMS